MFDHLEFKVENLEVSKEFYKKVLGALDIQLLLDQPELAGFGTGKVKGADGAPRVELLLEQGPRQKPRMHVAFSAPSPQHVDAFHKTALDCGARDNGKPGLRPAYHAAYYSAFVWDPDGHNIEAVCHT